MMPLSTALAMAAAANWSVGVRGPFWTLLPHEQLMTSGRGSNVAAVLIAAVELTKFHLTMRNAVAGAIENTLADSPVPCPLSSTVGVVVPGARTTSPANPLAANHGCANQPLSIMTTWVP